MSGSFLHLARVRHCRLYVQSPLIVNNRVTSDEWRETGDGAGVAAPGTRHSSRVHKLASTGGSILPPLMIAPTRPIFGGRRPAISAARVTAPDGSITSLSRRR